VEPKWWTSAPAGSGISRSRSAAYSAGLAGSVRDNLHLSIACTGSCSARQPLWSQGARATLRPQVPRAC
jgi:hypothetical protein